MQKKYLLITVALLLTCLTNAQAYLNINWENKNSSILQDSENNLYGLFSNHYVEYVNSEFSNQAFIYETHHMKAKINKKTDDSIDEIFISKINVSEIMDIKAKVFKKDTVHIYNFSEIQKLRTSESSENYDYYKIPNINEKDIVEMMYTVKKDFNFNGNKLIEESFPIISSKFILIENKTQKEVIDIKKSCDIYIDQIHNRGGWGYGMNSVESLSLGLVCLTELVEEYQKFIPDHPFIMVTKESLEKNIISLIQNKKDLLRKKNYSREWVVKYHDITNVYNALYSYYSKNLWIK